METGGSKKDLKDFLKTIHGYPVIEVDVAPQINS